MNPQPISRIRAPKTAPTSPAPSPAVYQPILCPRKVKRQAPTIPRTAVSTKPEGSFVPGIRNFAITPATKPMTIVKIKPTNILQIFSLQRRRPIMPGGGAAVCKGFLRRLVVKRELPSVRATFKWLHLHFNRMTSTTGIVDPSRSV